MQQHVIYAQYIIGYYHFLSHINSMIKHHHERWNGSGYPDGLSGTSIPIGSRIIGLVDTFDAMTTNRIYNTKRSLKTAADFIKSKSGILFDPQVVDVFSELFDNGVIHYLRGTNFIKVKEDYAWNESLKNLRKSESLSNDPAFKFKVGLKLLQLLIKMRKMNSAYRQMKEMESLSFKYQLSLPSEYLNEKALYYFYKKSFEDAIKLSEMVLSSTNESKLVIARAHRHLGMCYWKQNLNDAAFLEVSYSENIYLDLIKEYYTREDTEESSNIEYYQKVLEKHEEIETIIKNLSKIYDIQGRIQYTLGNFKKSMEYFNKTLEKKNEIGDDYGLSISYGGRGKLLSILKKYEYAETDFLTNIKITQRLNIEHSMYLAMLERVKNFIRSGDLKIVNNLLNKIKRDFHLDYTFSIVNAYALYKKKFYNKALENMKNLSKRKIKSKEYLLLYYYLLSKIHFKKNDIKQAIKNMEIAAMYARNFRYLYFECIYLKKLERYYKINGDEKKALNTEKAYKAIESNIIFPD